MTLISASLWAAVTCAVAGGMAVTAAQPDSATDTKPMTGPLDPMRGSSVKGRIHSEDYAPSGRYPFMAFLNITGPHNRTCGGALVSKLWVLTANRCISGVEAKDVTVLLGATIIIDNTTEKSHEIHKADVFLTPSLHEFDGFAVDFRIAMVRLRGNATLGGRIRTIPLRRRRMREFKNPEVGFMFGWGETGLEAALEEHFPGVKNPFLKLTNGYAVNPAQCKTELGVALANRTVCIMNVDRRTSPCQGDEGGPFMIDGKLAGVLVSTHPDCGSKPYSVVTPVFPYLGDIERATQIVGPLTR